MIASADLVKSSKTRLVRISSEDKSTGTNSRFTVNIVSSGGAIDTVTGYMVHSIEVPNVFPNIPTYANTLRITKTTGPVNYDVVIPTAYYSVANFIAQLQVSINLAIPDVVAIVLVGNAPEQYLQFTFVGDTYLMDYTNSNIADKIGLTATLPAALVQVMQSIPNLIGETALYVHSRTLAPNYLMEGSGSFSVVDKINLDKSYGATCYMNTSDDVAHFHKYIPFEGTKSLRTLSITLRNRTGQVLELPNNFYFSMMIVVFYR